MKHLILFEDFYTPVPEVDDWREVLILDKYTKGKGSAAGTSYFFKVKLPDGVYIAESDQVSLPVSPSGAERGIEGRRVTESWGYNNKDTGDLIPIRIYYEGSPIKPVESFVYRWLFVFVLVFVVVIFFVYRSMSRKSEIILSVLNEAERIVIDIIRKEGENKVDQRKIVTQSGFSKAKVTRIIQSLEARGVVSVKRLGRKNRVSLKKISFK